jgi:hypothetical protein
LNAQVIAAASTRAEGEADSGSSSTIVSDVDQELLSLLADDVETLRRRRK